MLLCDHSSVALAFLLKETFAKANRILQDDVYDVLFVTASGARSLAVQGALIQTRALRGFYHYLIVTPLDRVTEAYVPAPADIRALRTQHGKGTVIASACLGALVLAASGLLDDREATTHWAWMSYVRERFPQVNWELGRMISDLGDVITAGGYLAVVDLALHIVAATSSRVIAHRLGQTLLADSIRQKQSVYAQKLIDPQVDNRQLSEMVRSVERNLDQRFRAADMARRCRMSLRNFHRRFIEAYGTTPRKFIQIKRVEKAQELLRNSSRSVEQILQAIGVSDATSFRRIFQREIGYSPAEFRRKLRMQDPR